MAGTKDALSHWLVPTKGNHHETHDDCTRDRVRAFRHVRICTNRRSGCRKSRAGESWSEHQLGNHGQWSELEDGHQQRKKPVGKWSGSGLFAERLDIDPNRSGLRPQQVTLIKTTRESPA